MSFLTAAQSLRPLGVTGSGSNPSQGLRGAVRRRSEVGTKKGRCRVLRLGRLGELLQDPRFSATG